MVGNKGENIFDHDYLAGNITDIYIYTLFKNP